MTTPDREQQERGRRGGLARALRSGPTPQQERMLARFEHTGGRSVSERDATLDDYREAMANYERCRTESLAWVRAAAHVLAELNASGMGYGKLAKELGISKGRVQQIVARGAAHGSQP